MPDRDPEKAKQAKRKWYMKNKERVLKEKRDRRAAQKKLKPPKPPPTPEEIARGRELNWLTCNRYRATHSAKVRALNRAITIDTAIVLSSSNETVVPGTDRLPVHSESYVR